MLFCNGRGSRIMQLDVFLNFCFGAFGAKCGLPPRKEVEERRGQGVGSGGGLRLDPPVCQPFWYLSAPSCPLEGT